MITGIDHMVLLVENLAEATAGAIDAGFTVLPGGRHDSGGTENALIIFADGCYIELLSFTTAHPPPDHYFAPRWRRGPGLADVALRSTDIDADVRAISQRGLPFPPPTLLARERPDGQVASWRMSLPQILHPGSGLPFFIQDVTDRSIRVPVDRESILHPNGAVGIAGYSLVVNDLETSLESLVAILDRRPEDSSLPLQPTGGIATIPVDSLGRQVMMVMQPPSTLR